MADGRWLMAGGDSVFKFEKLDVWHTAIEFSDDVYRLTRSFPTDERFGLTQQMRRAAVSIAANIAEGSSRKSANDFARFVEIANGSLMETISHAAIAHRQHFLNEDSFQLLYNKAESIGRMLTNLRKTLKSPQ